MKDVNKVILVGRLGADPVRRSTKAGIPVANFPLATSRRVKSETHEHEEGKDGWEDETQWHQVVAWGRQGEICSDFLRKGNAVYIEGSLRTRRYDGKDGVSRMAVEVHADQVSFFGKSGKVNLEQASVVPAVESIN